MSTSQIELELSSFSIVAVGSFNPAIFQPLWLSGNNLIRAEEANDAKIEIIHNDIALFSTNWFKLQVTECQALIETQDPTMTRPLRDLALGIFKILEHTPVTAFGLNSNCHYKFPSEALWHQFGHHFAPKESWNGILQDPKLLSLTMQGKRDCDADRLQIKVEGSAKAIPGVLVHVNEHYDLGTSEDDSPAVGMEKFLSTLQDSWEDFLRYTDGVAEHLLKEGTR